MISIGALIFLIPGIIIGSLGSIFLKRGAKNFSLNPLKLIKNHEVFLGVTLFGISMLLYIPALKFDNLSVIYPLSSFSYVVIALLSVRLLKEKMNKFKWLGITLIIIGSFLIVK